MVWANIKTYGPKDLYIGSFYRPPDNHDPDYIGQLQKYLERIPTSHGAHLWLEGDFNLADLDWQNECITTYPTHGARRQLLTASKDAFLTQMGTEPTQITESSSSILDLFFTKNDTLVNQVRVLPGISDHEAVFIESSLCPIKKISPPNHYKNTTRHTISGNTFRNLVKNLWNSNDFGHSNHVEQIQNYRPYPNGEAYSTQNYKM